MNRDRTMSLAMEVNIPGYVISIEKVSSVIGSSNWTMVIISKAIWARAKLVIVDSRIIHLVPAATTPPYYTST